jgi:hypothetical protein
MQAPISRPWSLVSGEEFGSKRRPLCEVADARAPPALRVSKRLAILLVTGSPAKSQLDRMSTARLISTDTGMDHNVNSLKATIYGKSS